MIAEMVIWQPPLKWKTSYSYWREDCTLYMFRKSKSFFLKSKPTEKCSDLLYAVTGHDPNSRPAPITYFELDNDLTAEYDKKCNADRLRYETEWEVFDSSLPLACKPLLEHIPTSKELEETWLDICGAAVDQASADRALLWSRYRHDHRDHHQSATSRQSQQTFNLPALPPEIKREVYCWLLRQPRPVVHCPSKDIAMKYKRPLDLRILAVSRSSYSEALAVFLEENVVKMSACGYIHKNDIPPVIDTVNAQWSFTRNRVTAVLIHMTYEERTDWPGCVNVAKLLSSYLSEFTNLKKLKVEFCYLEFLNERETAQFEREILGCFDNLKSRGNFATQIVSALPA